MAITNNWLNTLQRSYSDIKNELISTLKTRVPEITDFSEGNIFIILISLFSAIAEVLHYYIDNMARETFFITARRYSSLKKHIELIDYHARSANPSMVDIIISRSDRSVSSANIDIPIGTVFTSLGGFNFLSTKAVTWPSGSFGVSVPVVQKTLVENVDFGTVPSSDIVITLGSLGSGNLYMEGTLTLQIGKDQWELVTTFAYSNSTSKHFMVILDDEMAPLIVFGNGRFGMKPTAGSRVTGSYYITRGEAGNLPEGSIVSVPAVVSGAISNAVATNVHASVGGTNYEDFNMIKEHAPLSIKTLGVAITEEDYRDLAMLTDGVAKAYVDYICGKFVDIYITPDGGGIAPQALLDATYNKLLTRKVITTYIQVMAAGVSSIIINMDVTGRRSFRSNDIHNLIVNTLMTEYSYQTSDVGRAVRVSDIYALLDNLDMVDYLTINNLFLKPWARPQGSNTTELNITFFSITNVSIELDYRFTYIGDGKIQITRGTSGQIVNTITVGTQTAISDLGNTWAITISNPTAGSYASGSVWALTILPNNRDQLISQFVIPVFNNASDITTNITETA